MNILNVEEVQVVLNLEVDLFMALMPTGSSPLHHLILKMRVDLMSKIMKETSTHLKMVEKNTEERLKNINCILRQLLSQC